MAQGTRIGRRQFHLVAVGQYDLALEQGVGMKQQRHTPPAEAPQHPAQPVGMVDVAVAERDRMHLVGLELQHIEIVHQAVAAQPGVEQQRLRGAAAADLYHRREAVLGAQHLASHARPERGAADGGAGGQQHVTGVVEHGRDFDRVGLFER